MSDTFYNSGDCFTDIKTANEQRANKENWRKQVEIQKWVQARNAIVDCINTLWEYDNRYVLVWEKNWFPGIALFMEDLVQLGYLVHFNADKKVYRVALDECTEDAQWKPLELPANKTNR